MEKLSLFSLFSEADLGEYPEAAAEVTEIRILGDDTLGIVIRWDGKISARLVRRVRETMGINLRFRCLPTAEHTMEEMPPMPEPPPEEERPPMPEAPEAPNGNSEPVSAEILKTEKIRPEDDDIIFGKPVLRAISPISSLNKDSGKVAIKGMIFSSDFRKINGRDKTSVSFEVADGTSAIKVNKLYKDDEAAIFEKAIKPGMWVIVQGRPVFSDFENDLIFEPSAVAKTKKTLRDDPSEHKRVELHLHTTMSAMDSLCDPDAIFELAAHMGHKAVAVTDHGVVQGYPQVMAAAKKHGVKAIYGVEAYCLNDLKSVTVITGESDEKITDEIIFFDIETTGLDADKCDIIEIAAVLAKEGREVASYHSLIKPPRPIDPESIKIHGITDEMVKDAGSIEKVLPEFLEFCGNRPLCAHNASFDIGFIKKACERQGIERKFCVIDSLAMARATLPSLRRHRLNNLADHFGFKFNHHRAGDDALVLMKIFYQLVATLEEQKAQVESLSDLNHIGSGGDTYHLIILVKNLEGLKALYELVTLAHLRYYRKKPIIPMSILSQMRSDLILGSACEAGELFKAVLDDKPHKELLDIASFYDFLEIQPIGNNRFLIDKGRAKDIEQLRTYNKTISDLAKELNKPICATGDVHFTEPGDSIYREIIMSGMKFPDASNQAPLYYKTTEEMLEEFSYLGEERAFEAVVTYPNMIADMCDNIIPLKQGNYPPFIEGSAEKLRELTEKRAMELYAEDGVIHPIVRERIDSEINPIIENGFDVIYMTAQLLVQKSVECGYLVGSRGSVGSSLVAYLTGITEVNSLAPHYRCPNCHRTIFDETGKYYCGADMPDMDCPRCGTKMEKDGFGIIFATFMGFKGEKVPDIDLNFSGEYQLSAHRHLISIFGKENVFKAGTIGTIQSKTAYGFVKKYLEDKGINKNRAEINRLVAGCTGIKRSTGQHPGGLIVLPQGRSIYEFTPLQHPADDKDSEVITTHFDFHSIHDNLNKFDLLGHDDPTMMRRLQELTGVDPTKIPMDDKETMGIFTSIKPLGIETDDILEETGAAAIPEFGTKFVRGILIETKPASLDSLIKISGLSHGTNVWRNNAQDILKEGLATLDGIIGCRDDLTKYLMAKGVEPSKSFEISEAVRKGKGLKPQWVEIMQEHDVPEWYIESCKKIKYLYPRAHATAYVMMGFRIAWYKVHRPLEFYSAYFTIRAGAFDASIMAAGDREVCNKYYALKANPKRTALEDEMMSTLEIVHEFYKRGFTFAPVDIYKSDTNAFKIEGKSLIMPFTSVKGVGEAAASSIVEERENGKFMSQEDIVERCSKAGKKVVEMLDAAGALKGIPKSAQLSLFDF